jgi:hypothetical protein
MEVIACSHCLATIAPPFPEYCPDCGFTLAGQLVERRPDRSPVVQRVFYVTVAVVFIGLLVALWAIVRTL